MDRPEAQSALASLPARMGPDHVALEHPQADDNHCIRASRVNRPSQRSRLVPTVERNITTPFTLLKLDVERELGPLRPWPFVTA